MCVIIQSEIFPDKNQGGRTFYNEAIMSAMKIPQVKTYKVEQVCFNSTRYNIKKGAVNDVIDINNVTSDMMPCKIETRQNTTIKHIYIYIYNIYI